MTRSSESCSSSQKAACRPKRLLRSSTPWKLHRRRLPRRRQLPGNLAPSDDSPASAVRIEVSDAGRKVVNLRIPLALGRTALGGVPGLSEEATQQIRDAISTGVKGPVFDVVDEKGDGVRVVLE